MTATQITVKTLSLTGIDPVTNSAFVALSTNTTPGNGHFFTNTGEEFVWIKNDSAQSVSVKVLCQTACSYGGAASIHDVTITVANGKQMIVGKFPPGRFSDANGNVQIDVTSYTAGSGVSIAVIKAT